MAHKNLHKANKEKKDEFYTQLADIENELKHYKDQFRGKVVFCNCDDPKESNFVKYFSKNFEYLGLKKLIATHYKDANLFTKESPYKLEYAGDKNGNRMPDPSEFMTEMIGTGDFRSQECIELLKEADIVVTNPPFSLFREYVAQLVEYNKKFLIIGNTNALTYKDIFKLIQNDKLRTGYTNFNVGMFFIVPDDWELFHHIDEKMKTVRKLREFQLRAGSQILKLKNISKILLFTKNIHLKNIQSMIITMRLMLIKFPKFQWTIMVLWASRLLF